MSNLEFFLKGRQDKQIEIRHVVSKAFTDDKGNPLEWVLRPISADKDSAIRKECTKKVPIVGKRGAFTYETDTEAYTAKMICATVVEPNLNNAELQNAFGVMGAEQLIKSMLLPGEYIDLSTKVQEVNGFNVTQEDLIEEAKN